MKIRFLVSISMILASSFCYAKTANFIWQDELCEFKGVYDAGKYSEKQLSDTVKMMQQRHTTLLNSKSYAFKPNQIAEINVDLIRKEYELTKKELKSLQPIPLKEFEQLKDRLLGYLDQEYKHHYLTALAFSQPQKLLIPTYGTQCLSIAKSLNTHNKSQLVNNAKLSMQRENKEQLKLGNDPQFLAKRTQDFYSKLQSNEAVQYAQIQLIREWSNCANPHQSSNDQLEQIFRTKVFIQSKEVYCDEP